MSKSPADTGDYSEEEDSGATHLDVVMSLLAVLLLNLFVLLISTSGTFSGSVETRYRLSDPRSVSANLSSYHPIYPFQQWWLVQAGRAGRVNMAEMARRAAAVYQDEIELDFPNGSKAVIEFDAEYGLTGFLLTIHLTKGGGAMTVNGGLFDQVIDLTGTSEDALQPVNSGALIALRPGDTAIALAYPWLAALQKSGRNPQVIEVPDDCRGKWCPALIRDTAGFASEDMFR